VLTPWAFSWLWKYLVPTRIGYRVALATEVNGHLLKEEDFMPYLQDISTVPLRIFIKMLDHAAKHTAEPYLRDIRVPTLIIGGEHDNFTPVWLSEKMHEMISGSELIIIPKGTHTAPIETPQLISLRLEKWLRKYFGQMPPDECSKVMDKPGKMKSQTA